jgi:hypothetical protein
LFSKKDIEIPLAYLPKPILFADFAIYYECWLSAKAPHKPISVLPIVYFLMA